MLLQDSRARRSETTAHSIITVTSKLFCVALFLYYNTRIFFGQCKIKLLLIFLLKYLCSKKWRNFLSYSSEHLTNYANFYQIRNFKILGMNDDGLSNQSRSRNSINTKFELFVYRTTFLLKRVWRILLQINLKDMSFI